MEAEIWWADAHTDAFLCLEQGDGDLLNWGKTQWDLAKCRKVDLRFQVMALFIASQFKPEQALKQGLSLVEMARKFINNRKEVFLIDSREQLAKAGKDERLGMMLSIEGGEILAGQVWMVDLLYRLGVRALGLTWNQRNDLAEGAGEHEANGGLTRLGKTVVNRLNQLGMAVDVSHLAERSFWDVLEHSEQPPYASHSCAAALCPHPRNLTDEQIRALARSGGVVGINFYPAFLNPIHTPNRADVAKHIAYIAQVAGPQAVALGSDFDGGDQRLEGLDGVHELPLLLEELEGIGFSRQEIIGIVHGNLINYFGKILR